MVRHSRVWLLNIHQDQWAKCVEGPSDANIHGETNVGKPWFGRRAKSHPGFKRGDIAIARLASRGGNRPSGAYGIWKLVGSDPVVSQKHVPWSNGPYNRVLYCRAIQRELPEILTERFEENQEIPFDQRSIQTDVKSLERKDARGYVRWLLGHESLSEEAFEALEGTVWELDMNSNSTTREGRISSTRIPTSDNRSRQRGRYQSTIDRRYRDETLVHELKELHNNKCQVCDDRRQKDANSGYSEVHHIKPLGHDGPDKQNNMLVLCPNHHADFDYGVIKVDLGSFELNRLYDDGVTRSNLKVLPEHNLDQKMLQCNNESMFQSL